MQLTTALNRLLPGLITLALVIVAAPAYAASKKDAFILEKKAFKKQYKTIALAPVDADPLLKMPPAVSAMLEEEITAHLEKRGFTVMPMSVLGAIRDTMEAQVGGIEDEEGRIYMGRLQAVRTHAFRELWFRHRPDAVATVRVRAQRVEFKNDRAEWDGVKHKVEHSGRSKKYTGNIFVSSVSFAVYDEKDQLLYSFSGGIEPLMRRDNDQLVVIDAANYFLDEKRIRKAAKIATSPI